MQWITQLWQHACRRSIYHGPNCLWCRHDLRPVSPLEPGHYLHPEPMYLHASGHTEDSRRHWLVVDVNGEPEDDEYDWRNGYRAKYNMNYEVELSVQGTCYTLENLHRALGWLMRASTIRGSYLTWRGSTGPPWDTLVSYIKKQQYLWVFLDGPVPPRCAYTYTVGPSGLPHISWSDDPLLVLPGTLLVLSAPSPLYRCLHSLVIDHSGHRSLHEILMSFPGQVTLGCNRSLDMNQTFFGFEPVAETGEEDAPVFNSCLNV